MRIVEEYDNNYLETIKITFASYLGNLTIQIRFDDGTEKVIDFKPFLSKSQHPSIRKYLNEELFSSYRVLNGNLNWNDYELIFPVWDLYSGQIR